MRSWNPLKRGYLMWGTHMDFGMETLTWFQALTTSFLSDVERWSPLDSTIIGALTELNYVFLRFNYWWKERDILSIQCYQLSLLISYPSFYTFSFFPQHYLLMLYKRYKFLLSLTHPPTHYYYKKKYKCYLMQRHSFFLYLLFGLKSTSI